MQIKREKRIKSIGMMIVDEQEARLIYISATYRLSLFCCRRGDLGGAGDGE